jgi:hypothetical protein
VLPGAIFAANKKNHLAPGLRIVSGGRDVQIIVPQAEIRPTFDDSRWWLGTVLLVPLDLAIDNNQARRAMEIAAPIREALSGYEFDPLVKRATISTLSGIEWFGLRETRLGNDPTRPALLSSLKAAGTAQVLYLTYAYQTDPHFTSVVVVVDAMLVNKAMPKRKLQKPIMRFWPEHRIYSHTMRSVIGLPGADPWKPEENAKAWAADGGKLARAALDLGVQRCQQLLKQSLEMSAEDAANMQERNDRSMSRVPGVTGWVLEYDASHMLVYSGDYEWITYYEKIGAPPAAPVDTATSALPAR